MRTKDGYDVFAGMVLTNSLDDDIAYEITKVHNDCVEYRELIWNEAKCDYDDTNDGGLLLAEELEQDYVFI